VVGGSITGTVKDDSGAAIPEAKLIVKNRETGTERRAVTDQAGRYAIFSVAIGRYEVLAEKAGFTTGRRTGIELVVGQTVSIDLTLPVGEIQQAITIEEAPTPVTLSTQQISGLVSERQVKDLPAERPELRSARDPEPGDRKLHKRAIGKRGDVQLSGGQYVRGFRPPAPGEPVPTKRRRVHGRLGDQQHSRGASGQLLGVDAVREFNVVTDTYGAEYGKRPGGQVSIVTASGTNGLHGTVYEFLRNSALDARNFFDQGAIPRFQRNSFGGNLGGPIRKDKAFLFANYEAFRQHLGLSDVTLVPDHAARTQAAPAVQPLLALWPAQNGPELGGGIALAYSHPLQAIREDFGTARFDYNLSNNDSLFAVYTLDHSTANTPSANPMSLILETEREQVVSLQEQHTFSPNVLNTARIGFSRAGYFFNGIVPVNVPGWVWGAPIGAIVIGGGTASNGASQITAAGANNSSNARQARNLFTYDDHIYVSRGLHQLEAGVWLQQLLSNDNTAQSQYGQASFTSLSTFLEGNIATFSVVPSPMELGWRSLEGAGFIQDNMKLRSNLQLRLGFRFESTNGWNEPYGRAANYLFDGGVIQTNPTVGKSVFTNNRATFLAEPRMGLAWDPFGKSKTVIHAGFGIYRALLDNVDYRLDQTAPFNSVVALKNIPVAGLHIVPGASLPSGSKISPSGIQADAFTPTVITWTIKVEQQITPTTLLALGYVGSHGYHELLSVDANEPIATLLPSGAVYYPAGAPLANPNVANTTTWLTEGLSCYNALEVDVSRRLSRGLQFRGVYTFSKSLDDGTALNSSVGANAPGFVMYPLKPKRDWGPSNSDVRHLAVVNATYELPFRGAGKWGQKLAGGWSVSAIETLQSGFPFTPQLGFNPTNNGDSRNPIRPSWNPAFSGPLILGAPALYFNPNALVVPAPGTYGDAGRNVLTGPGLAATDFSLAKNTPLSEKLRLQFRAELFNLFSRANFGTPNAVVFSSAATTPSPAAGVISSTATTSRQVQFGVKVLW
jgi:hypothetical protein